MAKKKDEVQIHIAEVEMKTATFQLVGKTPLIMERFQPKAWQELLFPSRRKNAAERESTMKHDPVAEFRGAAYRNRDPNTPALFHMPTGAFKKALAAAALDMPGATKAKMERLTSVASVQIDLFGIPNIFCAMVRNSDINRTPDVRTRPIFPEWAAKIEIEYMKGVLTERSISHLFGAAGVIVGVGGWRPQKGGSNGKWRLCEANDAEWKRIVAKQGRKSQQDAFDTPIFFNEDTAELLTWFEQEVRLREREAMLDTGTTTETNGKGRKRKPTSLPNVPIHEVSGDPDNLYEEVLVGKS